LEGKLKKAAERGLWIQREDKLAFSQKRPPGIDYDFRHFYFSPEGPFYTCFG